MNLPWFWIGASCLFTGIFSFGSCFRPCADSCLFKLFACAFVSWFMYDCYFYFCYALLGPDAVEFCWLACFDGLLIILLFVGLIAWFSAGGYYLTILVGFAIATLAVSIELFCFICFEIYWFWAYFFLVLLEPSISYLRSICDSGLLFYREAYLTSFYIFV